MNIEELKSTYKLYGYKINENHKDILICLYEEGRYFGADIIPLKQSKLIMLNAEKIRNEYSKSGYASKLKIYSTSIEAEIELYKSFFAYISSKKRNKKKYSDFAVKQRKINGGFVYKYINSPFTINGNISKNGITKSITEHLKNPKPQLVIIEASAGYGKTCTSFELLNNLLDSDSCEIPLMTELSRNRGANIFRYILLDEIDRQYPNLDSKIVKHEIQKGRIPLIIDGFDELLKKSNIVKSDKSDVFNEVETMLDTIGNLLKNSAKIILTTRKTAIFSGSEFKAWANKWNDKFDIYRYSIEVPRIKDWIGEQKLNSIREKNIPVEYIANPVLLTYLKNLKAFDFELLLEDPNSIVKTYFKSLMTREMERQDLKINPEKQYEIFKNTVKMLIDFDSSTEKQSFFKEIIYDQNKSIINDAIKLYSSNTDIEDLKDKLSNHAILDRKGIQENHIGFINDFVFGTFIGEIMSEEKTEKINKNWSSYMVELGVTAYKVQNKENKEKLWDKIEKLKGRFEQHSLFNFDITLRNALLRNYEESEFNSFSIFNIIFENEFKIRKSVFINCVFKKCVFKNYSFEDVTFFNCTFIECKSENDIKLEDMPNVKAINCKQENSEILVFYKSYDNKKSDLERIENNILLEIYNGQSKTNSLLKSINKDDKKIVNKAFSNLIDSNFIELNGLSIKLSTNKIPKIKQRIDAK